MAVTSNTETRLLADHLERSFRGGAWHGPAIRESLAGIDVAAATRRPAGFPHSIAALVRHLTFWIDAAYVRISGGSTVDAQADWPQEDELTAEGWTERVGELEQAHARLHALVLKYADDRLDDLVPGCDPTVRGMLLGVLQHNAYHTGQIVMMARELGT